MKPDRCRWLVLAATFVLTLFAVVSTSRQADAGVLKVRDDVHALSADDISRLKHVVDSEPFDARLLVTGESTSQEDLSRVVGSLVSEPDMVVVGLDPRHHRVQVHFGEQSGIPQAAWSGIERAGNDAFRQGDWAAGVAAIFETAAARVQTPGTPGAPAAPVAGRPSLLGPGLLLLVLAGIIGAALLFSRRRAMGSGYGYDAGYGPPGYGGGGYYGPPGGGGGMGPVGGGLIGAGLGGLAGYELGKMEGEREGRERDGSYGGRDNGSNDDGGNYDAGGGGSSWDDGGSGGGGDFGGGGDGGGGGSDF
jgi:hypothetical protein